MEIEQDLPQPNDAFLQQYWNGREALVEQERAQRSDYAFRQSLTPLAAEACAIVARIRAEEQRTLWRNNNDDKFSRVKEMKHHPGMVYRLARERMRTAKLWQIVRKMPKGALLHCHFDAMIDVDWLVDRALATEGFTIVADQSMCAPEARRVGSFRFQYSKRSVADATSIWDQNYQAKQLVPLQLMAKTFPEGGLDGFKAWLRERCTITLEESLESHLGQDAMWVKFVSCFPILNSMLSYEPIFRASMQRLLHELMDDGIRWVDLRIAFVFQYQRENCEEPETGYHEFFRAFGEEVEKFQATSEGKNFWGSRFIWTTLRSFERREIMESMKQCISVKRAYPDLVAGFDVVGQEEMGRSLADLTPEFFWFRKKCIENGVEIPFFFHAGECLGDGDETDHNLFDAILLGTRRIGHGFSLYKHPLLIELVKQKKIPLEVCPISNEVLRLTSSIKSHPAPALLSRGVDVALCSDDTAILGHGMNGLTPDFWQALQGWANLGLEGLGSLAYNSVRYAAYAPDQTAQEWNKDIKDGVFGDGIRAARLREWTSEWNKFCEWIVMDYAADYGSDAELEV
jgi:adenosine deaminase CECR1